MNRKDDEPNSLPDKARNYVVSGQKGRNRWALPALVLGGLALVSVGVGILSERSQPSPTEEHQEVVLKGIKYREQILETARRFIGRSYTQRGISFSSLDIPEYWEAQAAKPPVVTFVDAGPKGGQSFLVSNTYNEKGEIVGKHISAGRGNPVWDINLLVLPGLPIPTTDKYGGGDIPKSRLKDVTLALFELPSGLDWKEAEVCYEMPMDHTPRITIALVATGVDSQGWYYRTKTEAVGNALLLVTDPSLGRPEVPALCS